MDRRPIYGTLVFLGRWALAAARRHPGILTSWNGRIESFAGEPMGDTTEVFVYPYAGESSCDERPIVLRFLNSGTAAKVLEASSTCLDPG
jgi:hypothetical protein